MYRTILQDLPTTISGFAKHDPVDDFTTIVLNARLSHESNMQTYLHELKEHIETGDFDCKEEADQIEYEAHRKEGTL